MPDHKKLLEAALFMSPRPLMLNDLARIAGINSLGYIKQMLEELQRSCSDRGFEIANTREGWVMQVRQELLPAVAHLSPYSDLSEGCKRSLALIVYREPIKKSELIKIQGNKAYSYLKTLEKRGLIRSERAGRTSVLRITQEFERYFGEEKEKVRDALQAEFSKGTKVPEGPKETAKGRQPGSGAGEPEDEDTG